jgi:HD-GYP domain-containing protein (c-di-GMP phosphodiesterase class II)
MIRVDLGSVSPGARLAKPIYNDRGAVWLKAGTELSERYLGILRSRGIGAVFLEEDGTADVVVREAISEESRGQATAAVADVVNDLAPAIEGARQHGLAELIGWLGSGEGHRAMRDSMAPKSIQTAAQRLVADVLSANPAAAIVSPKGRDNYVLSHAVDVATTAVTIGKLLHLPRHALLCLARGCLLMDIGLTFVDPRILSKAAPLTPEERTAIQVHPRMGYEVLRAMQPADILVNTIALQHHERQDGLGYPRGLRGNNRIHLSAFDRDRGDIVLLAEIAAVADVYDALSSNRPQRPALPPDQVVATLRRIAGTHLNRAIVDEFLRNVPVYNVGLAVYVYGPGFGPYRGVVVRVHPRQLDRPVVRVFKNARGRAVQPFEVDLAAADHLTIRSVPAEVAASVA